MWSILNFPNFVSIKTVPKFSFLKYVCTGILLKKKLVLNAFKITLNTYNSKDRKENRKGRRESKKKWSQPNLGQPRPTSPASPHIYFFLPSIIFLIGLISSLAQ
jgi:hypothetical protein